MNRHWKQGFQRNIKNDNYRVEERLQEYDPTLYVMYNPETNEHLVMDGVLDIAVMRVPQIGFEFLDSRVVERIKQIHTQNGFSAGWELQESENRRLREQERQTEDIAYNMGKDMERAVKNTAYGYV